MLRPHPITLSRRGVQVCLLLGLVVLAGPGAGQENRHALGHPGFIVVKGAAGDTTGTFAWQTGPGAQQRSLVWEDGVLTIPVELVPETFGPDGLAVACGAELAGGGHGGRLVFDGGRYRVHEPLLLTDGTVTLYATAGELEILGERVTYRAPSRSVTDPRSSYLLLAGLVLLTLVLLRRARMGFRESGQR